MTILAWARECCGTASVNAHQKLRSVVTGRELRRGAGWLLAALFCALPGANQGFAAELPAVVDEPEGARYSLGLTLWHLGHQAEQVEKFHQFLAARNKRPGDLLPESRRHPPSSLYRLLLEPELLPVAQRHGWQAASDHLASGAGDAGPTVTFPLQVPRAGMYRLWVRYFGWPTGTGVTRLQLANHVPGKNPAPFVVDELYDVAVEKEGWQWKDILVDLPSGTVDVSLGHITRWWHAGNGPKGYLPRQIDCLYLTQELWEPAPSENLRLTLRKSRRQGIQWTQQASLATALRDRWQAWQVRPVSWEDRAALPELFQLSREFWRQQVDELAQKTYDEKSPPDYRRPERQVVFDDRWNMLANPVRIARQIAELSGDVSAKPLNFNYYWIPAAQLTARAGWSVEGEGDAATLMGGYGNFSDIAQHEFKIDKPGTYHVWVHYYNINYFRPWQGRVFVEGRKQLSYDHDKQLYPSDWDRMGTITVAKPGKVRLEVQPLPYRPPATYRRLYHFMLVDDAHYKPQGSVRPPLSRDMFAERATAAGARSGDSLIHWCFPKATTPLSQEVWAEASWPAQPAEQHAKYRCELAADSTHSVQIGLRNVGPQPLAVQVQCGPLTGQGDSFPAAVQSRVVAFCPTGPSRQSWSPFILLRRPEISIQPYQVAGAWLTIDSHGLPPGNYTSTVTLKGAGLPPHTVALQVRVSAVKIAPRQPVLVHGWTKPYDGDEYLQDFVDHGMNVWPDVMSKSDMRKWGIRLVSLQQWEATDASVRALMNRIREAGLSRDDYYIGIRDEPGGDTPEKLKEYIDVAQTIRRLNPQARICMNPSEAAKLKTFELLAPSTDVWLPYVIHLSPHYQGPEKRKIFTSHPWMWYTTPCNWDKSPALPAQMYAQIRAVTEQPGNCLGTAFFAFNYPWRDPWDTGYEHIVDAATTVLRSRHGAVPTRTWEAIREASQHTNLAAMVREKLGKTRFDQVTNPAQRKLITTGSVAELLRWLETH